MVCVLTALIRNEPAPVLGLRRHTAISSAFRTMSLVIRDCMDQPIILRENPDSNNHGKDTASLVGPDVGYVRYPNPHPEHPIELSLEPVGDTILAFAFAGARGLRYPT